MTAFILVTTTALLGILWFVAQQKASRAEFPEPARQRRWQLQAALIFAALVSVNLGAAASGVLSRFDRFPSPIMAFLPLVIAGAFVLSFSRFGDLLVKNTPLAWLVGFQGFRILAEAALYSGLKAGLAPIQMTFEGYNFDIVTGVTALAAGFYLHRKQNLSFAFAWNLMGVGFLLVIAFIANTSMPTPMRLFHNEPSNIWVTWFPYILLPGVLVFAAITGHILAFRKIRFLRVKAKARVTGTRSGAFIVRN